MPVNHEEKDQLAKMIQLVQKAIERDEALREQYEVGDKFRFIREKLQTSLDQLNQILNASAPEEKSTGHQLAADEVPVYVYLYNAHGLVLRSWVNMLAPKVFYEYSVNRPIYTDKSAIEALLKTKKNPLQHAYLIIAIKSNDILSGPLVEDASGNKVIKVREGSLDFEKLISLVHNGQEYQLDQGNLVKK